MRKSIAKTPGCLRCRVRRVGKRCTKQSDKNVCKECGNVFEPVVKSLSAEVLLTSSDWSSVAVKFAVDIGAETQKTQLPVSSPGTLQHAETTEEARAEEDRPPGMTLGAIGSHLDGGAQQAPSVNVGTGNSEKVNCLLQEAANDAYQDQHDGAEPLGRLVDTRMQTTLEIYVMDKDLKVGLVSDDDFEAVLNDLPQEYFEIGIGVPVNDHGEYDSSACPSQVSKKPSINIELLDDFIRRGVLGKILIQTWPSHLSHVERKMLDNAQLFVGYLNMLRSLNTVSIINRNSRDTRWSASNIASEMPYTLAFRAEDLFNRIKSDCDVPRTRPEGDVQSQTVMEVLELLYLSLKVIGEGWGNKRPQSSEESLATLQRNLFENSFRLVKKILCNECLYSNKSTSTGKSVMTDLLSSLQKASRTRQELFPTCFLIVRQDFDRVHPQHWLHRALEISDPYSHLRGLVADVDREPTSTTCRPDSADSKGLQLPAFDLSEAIFSMYADSSIVRITGASSKHHDKLPPSMGSRLPGAQDVGPEMRFHSDFNPTQTTHMSMENMAASDGVSRPSWTHASGMTAAATIDQRSTGTFENRSSTSFDQLPFDSDLDNFPSLESNFEWLRRNEGINRS